VTGWVVASDYMYPRSERAREREKERKRDKER